MNNKKVIIGMSGGVDSSVGAYLLKKAGYDVIGVTMQIWQDEDAQIIEENGGCCGLSAVDDARRVAESIGIPHYVMNFKSEFKKSVIDYFIKEYLEGRTPNPCIACNRYVKWESLLNKSISLGAHYIATGHYAQITKLSNGRYTLKKSEATTKDQTYALYNLTQYQLKHTLMPVGQYTKDEIRQIASDINLNVANKPDSQEICFIPDNNYGKFIKENTYEKIEEGNFVNQAGKVIGTHKGITHYTIGQRKGLNLAMGKPVFVTAIHAKTNEVVIGDSKDLFTDKAYASNLNFMSIGDLEEDMRVTAKIRYSHKGSPCTIKKTDDDILECTFDEPQRAITPGQALVLYHNDYVLGGGVIIKK